METGKCVYCGRNFKAEDKFRLLQKIRRHLRDCPVRSNGVNYNIGSKIFNVKPWGVRVLTDLKKIAANISIFSAETQEACFLTALVSEKNNKRIRDFTVVNSVSSGEAK